MSTNGQQISIRQVAGEKICVCHAAQSRPPPTASDGSCPWSRCPGLGSETLIKFTYTFAPQNVATAAAARCIDLLWLN
ncbi:hypothetical protein ACLKA6_014550 [Drosophila palustris]